VVRVDSADQRGSNGTGYKLVVAVLAELRLCQDVAVCGSGSDRGWHSGAGSGSGWVAVGPIDGEFQCGSNGVSLNAAAAVWSGL
jgi:hypothetical protein